ncbi:MAG: hypothetical protein U9R08_03420 [Nanoarchaeota archaeon]|nr:hypothetical protein [Nanoarchaeota archaeon]
MLKVKIMTKGNYDPWVAISKVAKNTAVMFGAPAVLYVLSQINFLVPSEWLPIVVPIAGMISYGLKNYIENR